MLKVSALASFSLSLVATSFPLSAGVWLKGDLHAHSNYSDGDSSVPFVLDQAKKLGFNYFVLTDHDSKMDGEMRHWYDLDYRSNDLILLYGVEWTTSKGHANIFSTGVYDYSKLWETNRQKDPRSAMNEVESLGGIFSVNHPNNIFLKWKYSEIPTHVEVWNGSFNGLSQNGDAIGETWESWLQSGHKVFPVGGSDKHNYKGPFAADFSIGNPTTWVYAEETNSVAVLEGIKLGHTIMTYSPEAPRPDFTISANGINLKVGDSLADVSGKIEIKVSLSNIEWESLASNTKIEIIKNGQLFAKVNIKEQGPVVTIFDNVLNKDEKNYYRLEMKGKPAEKTVNGRTTDFGDLLALTSPIFINW